MIGLLFRLVRWVRSMVRHTEQYEEVAGTWPHTFNDLDPSTMPGAPERKTFDDGLIGVPHPLKWPEDYADVDKLATVYGKTIPREALERWAAQTRMALAQQIRRQEIHERLAEIPTDIEHTDTTGYKPVGGLAAGTSPKTGIVLPPTITDQTTKEWCDLRLEDAYGKDMLPRILSVGLSAVDPQARAVGFSMRYLNELRLRAERRDRTLAPYDIAVLRSRGIV